MIPSNRIKHLNALHVAKPLAETHVYFRYGSSKFTVLSDQKVLGLP